MRNKGVASQRSWKEGGMDPAHPPSTSSTPPSRLTALRALVPKVLFGHESVTALKKLADKWLLSSSIFGEECELVNALLYTTLAVPDGFTVLPPKDVVYTFLERWVEDGGEMEFHELMSILKLDWKCGAVQIMFLLCANLMPDDWAQPVLQADFSAWPSDWLPNVGPPVWLLDALGSNKNLTDFITLLRVSASMLQGVAIPQIKVEDSYLGTLTKFFYAAKQYQQGEYRSSLDTLQKIKYMSCEVEVQAWVSHLEGLGLAKLGIPHNALVKLQTAVDTSPASLLALYNIAQIFHSLGEQSAELEVLELLVKSGGGEMVGPRVSLHSLLLTLHHTHPENLVSRAQYCLSCRYFQEKKFLEAAENLETLLTRETANNTSQVSTTPRSLLKTEDTLPTLPLCSVILVLAAMAHAATDAHQETLKILDHNLRETAVGGSSFYHDLPEDRLRVVVSAAGQVLYADALKGLGQETEALKEFIRVEQALWWVRGVGVGDGGAEGGDAAGEWDTVILQIKTFLYKMLSEIHKTRGNLQNHHHYTRLAKQCFDILLTRFQKEIKWQDLSPPNQLAMDAIQEYLKRWLEDAPP